MDVIAEGSPRTEAGSGPGEERQELGRSLRSRHVAMIAIGGIIGAGLFVGSSASIAAVGPAVVLSYGLAGLLVLLVMRMLSEMAVAVPGTQSFPDFARLGLGDWAGFLSGWLYWYFWVVVVAIEAIAGAVIIHGWIDLPVWLIGVALMAVLTAVNLMSTRSYGEFEFWLSSIKVAAIIAFIAILGGHLLGLGGGDVRVGLANLTGHGGFAPFGWRAVLAGVTSVIFALTGAEIATVAAAESAEPARTVARITGTVAVRILVFYILSVLLIVATVPWNTIQPGVSPFATALTALGIPGAATMMTAVVLVAVLSCLNSGLYVTSRVLFSLARHGEAPAALVRLNRRVPARAILVASLFSYAALAASVLSPAVVFTFLVNASGALMLIIYGLLALAQIRLRRRLERENREGPRVRMWLFPWLSYATVLGMAAVMVAMALTPDLASQLYSSLFVAALCLLAYVGVARARRAGAA